MLIYLSLYVHSKNRLPELAAIHSLVRTNFSIGGTVFVLTIDCIHYLVSPPPETCVHPKATRLNIRSRLRHDFIFCVFFIQHYLLNKC